MTSRRKYQKKSDRANGILDAARALALRDGWGSLTRDGVAREADVANGSVSYCFTTVDNLKDALIERAIECQDYEIIALGLSISHPLVKNLDDSTKQAALQTLM